MGCRSVGHSWRGAGLTELNFLSAAMWGEARRHNTGYLRVAVRSLRLKLEEDRAAPRLIVNDPGVGSRLSANVLPSSEQPP